jgi:hypothetical protein
MVYEFIILTTENKKPEDAPEPIKPLIRQVEAQRTLKFDMLGFFGQLHVFFVEGEFAESFCIVES